MVQKSGDHLMRLVVYSMIYNGFVHSRWCRISEPSTVSFGSSQPSVTVNHEGKIVMIIFPLLLGSGMPEAIVMINPG